MARVLVDTSAVYALLDRDDAHHTKAKAALGRLRGRRAEPLLTNFIVAECHALLLARLGSEMARRWLSSSAWPVERVTEADEAQAREIICTRLDQRYSYTDATSFAVMNRLKIRVAFAFDRHFAHFGFGPP